MHHQGVLLLGITYEVKYCAPLPIVIDLLAIDIFLFCYYFILAWEIKSEEPRTLNPIWSALSEAW